MKRTLQLTLAAMFLFGITVAQENFTEHPGYIDLSGIQIPNGAGEVTEVNIGPELFSILAEFGDDEANTGMPFGEGGMFSINVKTFEIDTEHTERVRAEMAKIEKKLLKEITLFDVYEGDKIEKGKKSYALSFTLLNEEKTLTDKQIDKVMMSLAKAYEREFGALVRGLQ